MADNAPSTAEQFISKGVAPDVAADLARQENSLRGINGFAAQAEVAHRMDNYVPAAAPPPQVQGDPNVARAEWDKLMADRSAGTISNFEWNAASAVARRDALVATIAGVPPAGQAAKLSVQELSDSAKAHDNAPMDAAMAADFAPAADPSEFSLPEPAGGHTDETIAYDAKAKAAFHAAGMSPKTVNLAAQMLRQDLPGQEGKSLDQLVDTQTTGLERMWKGDADSNLSVWRDIVTGWQRSSDPLIRQYSQAAPRLNPIVVNQLVEEAKYRTARSK
jgi:hypothetical protein